MFMLFAAPPEKDVEWSEAGAEGAFRFLNRVWRITCKWHGEIQAIDDSPAASAEFSTAARGLRRKTHQTIARVTHDIRTRLHFNTAIASLMELTNELYAFDGGLKDTPSALDLFAIREALEALAKMLSPFTPHIAEELWEGLGHDEILVSSAWPSFDAELAKADELEIPVQLNGKLVARIVVPADITDDALAETALANDRVQDRLNGRQVAKTIVVPKRLVNLVAR
jgi:leucyl-tRNA synthetase